MKPNIALKFIVANWKMYTNAAEAKRLAETVVGAIGMEDRVSVALCPPFPYLALVGEILKGSRFALGAQNLYPEKEGAFTGEVSPTMLLDLGCKYVIVGHSERRHKLGESDSFSAEGTPEWLVPAQNLRGKPPFQHDSPGTADSGGAGDAGRALRTQRLHSRRYPTR